MTLFAQEDRITARIDNNQRVPLPGHVHPSARPQFDQGPVAPSFQLPAITIYLKPSSAQQSDLEKTLAEQQDPASPNYHKWLTPEQYADRFGASQSDIDKLTAWLESQGFQVGQVARSRTWIVFSGTAQQVQNAFQTQIHQYQVNGNLHYANASDPSVPAAFAGLVRGFRGLHDFRLKPRIRRALHPELTNHDGSHNIAPDDFATIYDVARLYQAGIDGSGQKLAIAGQTEIQASDLDIQTFRSRFNLPALNLQPKLVPGHPNPGVTADADEARLDIEWSSAVARKATIIYVYSEFVTDAVTYAIDQNLAPVVSMSYGNCEESGLVNLPTFQSMAQQGNAQGITWVNAAGDNGAADCEDVGATAAQDGLAVDAPASVPEVTGMGGTEFNEQTGPYWSSTNSPNSASALSYIPEMVWNDTPFVGSLAGAGGGASIFFPKPAWQTGPGVPSDSFRDVPDLSLAASPDHDGYVVYTGGHQTILGGTSFGAPTMAGIVTLLNQYLVTTGAQSQPGVGNINPTLYRLAQSVPGVFHDVTAGNNIVPCIGGSPGCNNGSYGYSATPGYDQASGLGSPDAYNLVHQWTNAAPQNSAVVVSFDQNPVFQSGSSWPFTITLTEEAGVGTTLTSFRINGNSYNLTTVFGTTTLPPHGTASSNNFSLSGLPVPADVQFVLTGMDANGASWYQQISIPFFGPQVPLTVGGAGNSWGGQKSYAPGMWLSVYGTQLGNFAQTTASIPFPLYLAGFEATVNSVPAPLYFVSPGQVNLQIPYETPLGPVTLGVGNPYQNVNFPLNIVPAAPGIATQNGLIAAPFSSAKRGDVTTLFVTGVGKVQPPVPTGDAPPAGTPNNQLPQPVLPVTLTVAGIAVDLTHYPAFIGIPTWSVGVTQINYQVPVNAPLGVQQVVVTVGGFASPPANLTITQ